MGNTTAGEPTKNSAAWREQALAWLGFVFLLMFAWFFISSEDRFKDPMPGIYLGLGILLLAFPFLESFKFGSFLEVKRKIDEVKAEAKETRQEMRQSIQALSVQLQTSAQATVNNNTYYVTREEVDRADASLTNIEQRRSAAGGNTLMAERSVDLKDLDPNLALARTRMTLERLLRLILRKSTDLAPGGPRMMGVQSLANAFMKANPDYQELQASFKFVIEACNAAIHGQRVDLGTAQEAISTGERVVALLARDFDIPTDQVL